MDTDNKTIAILGGTGKEGPGLAMRWATAGYRVLIGSRELEKARRVAAELNEKLGIDTIVGLANHDAAGQAEICVLTVLATAHQAALKGLKEALRGKILIDTTARVDFRAPRAPEPPSVGRIAQEILGGETRVAAALQNVPAHRLRQNIGGKIDADVMVFVDDPELIDTVVELIQAGGMRAYYAGGLDDAIVAEGLTAVLIHMNRYYGIKTASITIHGIDGEPG